MNSILLIRALDAGDTHISFRWLDDAERPIVHRVPADVMRELMARLDRALIGGQQGEGNSVESALSGPLTRPDSEYALAEDLSRSVMPEVIRTEVSRRGSAGSILIRITPSRVLARVPWELLVVGGLTRLVDVADLCYEPPAAVHVGRARLPAQWTDWAAQPVTYIVDPLLPPKAGLGRIYLSAGTLPAPGDEMVGLAAADTAALAERVRLRPATPGSGVGRVVGRSELSHELRIRPARLVYVGHVSATLEEPGSASLHLSDEEFEWGLAEVLNDVHRPLSALDLLLGTSFPDLGEGDAPEEGGLPGHDLWPMPARVAVIACEGGADYRSSETFGLVLAIFNAGAEVVTTTRWIMPSDNAFRVFAGSRSAPGPTTEMALAIDDTHCADDPVRALGAWQRSKLHAWRDNPSASTSPLTWAGVTCHVCPAREVFGA